MAAPAPAPAPPPAQERREDGARSSRPAARLPVPTTRGAVVAGVGVALVVVGVATGLPALVRAGALALALPVVAALVLVLARPRARVERSVQPASVPVGAEARVRLRVEVLSAPRLRGLLAQDARSPGLGARSRFVVASSRTARDPVAPTSVTYRVRPLRRGEHGVGPLSITVDDPLHLVRAAPVRVTEAPGHDGTLLALPTVVPLRAAGGRVAGSGAGQRSAQVAGGSGDHAAAVRRYRAGDDVRRVHWRATARADQLMVREEESSAGHRAVVVLVTAGPWQHLAFERAVDVAASAVALLGTDGAPVELHAPGAVAGSVEDLLRVLAVVAPDTAEGRRRSRAQGSTAPDVGSEVVAVVSGLSGPDVVTCLPPVRAGAPARTAVVVGGGRGGGPGEALRAAGWRVAEIDEAADLSTALPAAWAGLDAAAGGPAQRGAA